MRRAVVADFLDALLEGHPVKSYDLIGSEPSVTEKVLN